MGLTGNNLQALIVVACGAAFMLFGYDQGVLSGLIGTEDFKKTFNYPSSGLLGSIVGLYNIGAAVGALAALAFGDMLGRKKALALGCVVIVVGTALQASAFSVAHMIVARIVTGVGTGLITVTVPCLQAECSKAHNRGRLIMIEAVLLIFGIVLTTWINYGFVTGLAPGPLQWRIPIALQAVFPIITLVILPFIPESPRWLCSKGRTDEMIEVLRRLEPGSGDTEARVQKLGKVILEAIEEEKQAVVSWKDLISVSNEMQDFRRLVIAVTVMFIQQFTGINAIVYFAPEILIANIGVSQNMALILSGVGAIIFWCGCICTVFLIDRIGRRPLLLGGVISCFVFMMALFAAHYIGDHSPQHKVAAGWGWTAMFFCYYFGFGLTYCNIPWLYSAEICSLRMRNKAHAISTASVWIFTFIAVQITPTGLSNLGPYFWILWAAFNAIFIPIVYFFFPETALRSLEEMDHLFVGHTSWFVKGDQKRKGRMPVDYKGETESNSGGEKNQGTEKRIE